MATGNMRVLLVEDQPLIRLVIAERLSDDGFAVVEAEDGDQAVKQISTSTPFRMLITDIQMPGNADGNVVAQEAKAKSDLSIVYMTGNPSSLTQSLGPYDALILKPFSPGELMIIVQRLLSLRTG
jgi:two-component system cell cycle response regulator CpdR